MQIRRVLAVGGAGDMGRHATRLLCSFGFLDEVIVAGLETAAATKFVHSLGAKARFLAVDINQEAELRAAIRSVDVVVNTAGPFYKLGLKVATAALAEGKHYLDICDDPEPSLQILQLNAAANAAGISMIVGLGLSPGVSNLLAAAAVEKLDEVNHLDTTWDVAATLSVDDGFLDADNHLRTTGAAAHGIHMCFTDANWLVEGHWVDTLPMQPYELCLPNQSAFTGWSVAHPESVTLPMTYPGLRQSRNLVTGPAGAFEGMQHYRDQIRSGALQPDQAAAEMSSRMTSAVISPETEAQIIETRDKSAPLSPPLFSAIAMGERRGEPACAAAWINRLPAGGMGAGTGIPVALGVELLHAGKITRWGAFAPEAAINPYEFFERYEKHCTAGNGAHPLIETVVAGLERE